MVEGEVVGNKEYTGVEVGTGEDAGPVTDEDGDVVDVMLLLTVPVAEPGETEGAADPVLTALGVCRDEAVPVLVAVDVVAPVIVGRAVASGVPDCVAVVALVNVSAEDGEGVPEAVLVVDAEELPVAVIVPDMVADMVLVPENVPVIVDDAVWELVDEVEGVPDDDSAPVGVVVPDMV